MGPINMVAGLKGDYGLAKNLTLLYGNKGGGVVLKVESSGETKHYHVYNLKSGATFKQIDIQTFNNMASNTDMVNICTKSINNFSFMVLDPRHEKYALLVSIKISDQV